MWSIYFSRVIFEIFQKNLVEIFHLLWIQIQAVQFGSFRFHTSETAQFQMKTKWAHSAWQIHDSEMWQLNFHPGIYHLMRTEIRKEFSSCSATVWFYVETTIIVMWLKFEDDSVKLWLKIEEILGSIQFIFLFLRCKRTYVLCQTGESCWKTFYVTAVVHLNSHQFDAVHVRKTDQKNRGSLHLKDRSVFLFSHIFKTSQKIKLICFLSLSSFSFFFMDNLVLGQKGNQWLL